MNEVEQVKKLLLRCSEEQRRIIFGYLRNELDIHPLESQWNVRAEVILEAINRASDLTQRGVRGVIAEAVFEAEVVDKLVGWNKEIILGNPSYDVLLWDTAGQVRIQVKLQRQERQRPKIRSGMYVVETQRTRRGENRDTGETTRPYRFGEFDILAVSLHPSTNEWDRFMYTVADWLIPNPNNENSLEVMQPVAMTPSDSWTDNLETCLAWFRSGLKKSIDDFPAGRRRRTKGGKI